MRRLMGQLHALSVLHAIKSKYLPATRQQTLSVAVGRNMNWPLLLLCALCVQMESTKVPLAQIRALIVLLEHTDLRRPRQLHVKLRGQQEKHASIASKHAHLDIFRGCHMATEKPITSS